MKLIARRMRGMQDVTPDEAKKWEYIEKVMKEEAELYGFGMLRTPVVEATGLFRRETDGSSDMVNEEMYSFKDKGGRLISLRPEGTTGVIRAVFENDLHSQSLPAKLMYMSPCYRYVEPQMGKFREFYQFGFEIIGGNTTMADAEVISLTNRIFQRLGLRNIEVMINAIGCEGCRPNYIKNVKSYFKKHEDSLCEECRCDLEKNPLKIFSCKNVRCQRVSAGAPKSISYICKDCAEHFQKLKNYTGECGINARVDQYLFGEMNYYTKSVFEFVDYSDTERFSICSGGRYDNLTKEIGGVKLMSVGVGISLEKLINVMEKQKVAFPKTKPCSIYLAPLGASARMEAVKMVHNLRKAGIKAEMDLVGRFIKPQMKYADKIKAKYTIVIGNDEMVNYKAMLKNMTTGRMSEIKLGENFVDDFVSKVREDEENLLNKVKTKIQNKED